MITEMKLSLLLACLAAGGCSPLFGVASTEGDGGSVDAPTQLEDCVLIHSDDFQNPQIGTFWDRYGQVGAPEGRLILAAGTAIGAEEYAEIASKDTFPHPGLVWTANINTIVASDVGALRDLNLTLTTSGGNADSFTITIDGDDAMATVELQTRINDTTATPACDSACTIDASAPFAIRVRLSETRVFYEKNESGTWVTMANASIAALGQTPAEMFALLGAFAEDGASVTLESTLLQLERCPLAPASG